jgi:hypothetical protein
MDISAISLRYPVEIQRGAEVSLDQARSIRLQTMRLSSRGQAFTYLVHASTASAVISVLSRK